jgi:hypothetical protein
MQQRHGFLGVRLSELCRDQSSISGVVVRFIFLTADPKMMELHCKLLCHGDDRAFFPLLPLHSANFGPHRRGSESLPNGPRMCCTPCTSTMGR